MRPTKILITGANGQLGTELSRALRKIYDDKNIIASDISEPKDANQNFVFLDILNKDRLKEIIQDYEITQIYHLAAILSANGEWNPLKTWNVNFNGLMTILEVSRILKIEKIFFPSTIAVFGDTTPKIMTPQATSLVPKTVYGISKTTGELWAHYYYNRYGLDVRSLRYPGIIGHQSIPAGGTTDYAVEIYHEALKHGKYTSFLDADTRLPMIYMSDAIRATISLMQAPSDHLSVRYSYNIASMSFTPAEIAQEITRHIPNFKIEYKPDFRQKIAETWSESIDDSIARNDWGWSPQFDLEKMTVDMLQNLKHKYQR